MFSDTALACFHNSNASTSRQLPAELSLSPLSPARPGELGALAMGWRLRGFPLGSRPRCSPEPRCSQGRDLAASAIPAATWHCAHAGTCSDPWHGWALCVEGDRLVSSPSLRPAPPSRFPSPGIRWRAARSAGLEEQQLPGSILGIPYGRSSLCPSREWM